MSPEHLPQSRYILPSFVERTSYGVKESNPYNKLFEERIIFLGVQIDDASANDVMAQLLHLEHQDPDRDIIIYINSPGGSFTSLMAIYDTMQFVRPDIQTVCLGQAASAAAVLLAAGTPGKRFALPNSRVLIHQPATEGIYGQVSDLEIQATEIQRVRALLETTLAKHTNKTPEEVRDDIERDKILTADQAKEYGIIDEVLPYRKGSRNLETAGPVRRRGCDSVTLCTVFDRCPLDGVRRPGSSSGTARVAAARCRVRDQCCRQRLVRPSCTAREGHYETRQVHRETHRRGQRSTVMARIGDGGDLLKCSFCGKSQKQVKKLIAGPGVYICDECIDLCNEIIEEELAETSDVKLDELPKPTEIHDFLEQYVIGQDDAKRTLVGRGLQPLQADPGRRQGRAEGLQDEPVELAKSNILMLGPDRAAARPTWRRPWPSC